MADRRDGSASSEGRRDAVRRGATGLDLYTATASRACQVVLRDYSTSFGMASRLLPRPVRARIAAIYALVRLADEIVDGPASEAGVDSAQRRRLLDELESEVEAALERGFSTNLVVHAFQYSARRTGFGVRETRPFFASMRRDLDPVNFTDPDELARYVHGSAEVVGLMCLQAFLADERVEQGARQQMEEGAKRLGAAFQKVNFVRDLAADADGLGRRYLPLLDPAAPTESGKNAVLDDVDADLAAAARTIPLLPRGARQSVAAAHGFFAELSRALRATPAEQLRARRVRVPAPVKLRIIARATVGTK